MTDSKNQPDPNSDDPWEAFDEAEAASASELDSAYAPLEQYNDRILRETIGLEDAVHKFKANLSDADVLAGEDLVIRGGTRQSPGPALFLQPDQRDKLHATGQDIKWGDPRILRYREGELPYRTVELIRRLYESTHAREISSVDDGRGDVTRILAGEAYGVPVELEENVTTFAEALPDKTTYYKALSIRVNVPKDEAY